MYASPVLCKRFDEEWESGTEALTKAEREAVLKAVAKGRVITDPKLAQYVPLAARLLRESLLVESETSPAQWCVRALIVVLSVWRIVAVSHWWDWVAGGCWIAYVGCHVFEGVFRVSQKRLLARFDQSLRLNEASATQS